jgi:endoglucanase
MPRRMKPALLALVVLMSLAPPARAQSPGFRSCINLGNALDAPSEGEWGYVIRHDDIRMVASAGFDAVRIPIRWSAHAKKNAPYTIDPAFFDRVDQVAGWALAAGLTTIIDIHHDRAFKDGSQSELDRIDGLWGQIAAHYRDAPPDLIFELVNEPPGSFPKGFMDRANARLVATIRATNPTRRIIYGADRWNSFDALTRMVPPDDPNLIATFHYYDPFPFTAQGMGDDNGGTYPTGLTWGARSDLATLYRDFDRVAEWAAKHDQPVLLGEFGVNAKAPLEQRAAWITAVRFAAEKRGFAWCNWAFHAEFDAVDEDGKWIAPVLDALLGP